MIDAFIERDESNRLHHIIVIIVELKILVPIVKDSDETLRALETHSMSPYN